MTGLGMRGEDVLIGLIALVIVLPWIGWTIRRGFTEGRLPIGRGHVSRAERPGAFGALMALYLAALLMVAFIGIDSLFGITL